MGCVNSNPSKSPQHNVQIHGVELQKQPNMQTRQSHGQSLPYSGNIEARLSTPESFSIEILCNKSDHHAEQNKNEPLNQPDKSYKHVNLFSQNNQSKNNRANNFDSLNKKNNQAERKDHQTDHFRNPEKNQNQHTIQNKNYHKDRKLTILSKNKNIKEGKLQVSRMKQTHFQCKRSSSLEQKNQLGKSKDEPNAEQPSSRKQFISIQRKIGSRTPRGRSCNLFKTFRDDCIQDQDLLELQKKDSKSLEFIQDNFSLQQRNEKK